MLHCLVVVVVVPMLKFTSWHPVPSESTITVNEEKITHCEKIVLQNQFVIADLL